MAGKALAACLVIASAAAVTVASQARNRFIVA